MTVVKGELMRFILYVRICPGTLINQKKSLTLPD